MLNSTPKDRLANIVMLFFALEESLKDAKSTERMREKPKASSITIIKNLKIPSPPKT